MAPKKAPRTTGGGLPNPDSNHDAAAGNFAPFLKASAIGKEGTKATITFTGQPGRAVSSDFGDQIAFPVKFGGKLYDFGIKIGSGNHTRLFDRFGKKPPKGAVKVEVKTFNRNAYVAIV